MDYPGINNILYLESSIIIALRTKCGLSQSQITHILENAGLLEYIEKSYAVFHVEGIYPILDDIKRYLSTYNINIKIKEMMEF